MYSFDEWGYLAGSDADRAADVNAFFADPTIKMIIANRGGYGCGTQFCSFPSSASADAVTFPLI
jgi:muramoyltetrapeptide carboxypeptidase LdcA involved in peptidoglycan recycling